MKNEYLKMESKKCSRCLEIKSVDNFYISRINKSGYRWACRDCERIYKFFYYNRHPDRFKKAYKEFIERNPNYQKEYRKKLANK